MKDKLTAVDQLMFQMNGVPFVPGQQSGSIPPIPTPAPHPSPVPSPALKPE